MAQIAYNHITNRKCYQNWIFAAIGVKIWEIWDIFSKIWDKIWEIWEIWEICEIWDVYEAC